MSVRIRLALTFALLIGLFLIPVQYAGVRLDDLREMAVEGRGRHAAAILAVGNIRAGLSNFDRRQRSYLATLDSRIGDEVQAVLGELGSQLGRLGVAGFRGVARGLEEDLDSLVVVSQAIDRLIQEGRVEEATRAFERVAPLRASLETELERIAAAIDQHSAGDFARAEEMSASAMTTTIVATIACALLALLAGIWTTGALTTPLTRLSEAVARVADETFEEPEDLPYERSDEIGDLSRAFRTMTKHLAELDRMKAEFMSVAGHELKTPINVIRGYAKLIEEELSAELTEPQREILDAIAEQTRIMSRLASRLLDIGRLEAGSYRMEVEEVHVEDLLTGLTRAFEVLAQQQKIRLRTEVADTAPTTVDVDPDMLRDEVLGNLVSNALRFTPEGGEVRVRVWGEGEEVVFEVSDTGPGIPEEQRDHIFEKYYQGDRTRSMGAGLGLAVAQEVVEAHGGRIAIQEEEARGATFRVSFPVSAAESSEEVS